MKKIVVTMFALLLCFSLASCGEKEKPLSNDEKIISEVSESPTVSVEESKPEKLEVTGKIVSMEDSKMAKNYPNLAVGTEKEFDKWNTLKNSSDIAHIDVCNMNDSEAELSTEKVIKIMDDLNKAEIKLFDILGNPMAGGTFQVIAYDSENKQLFHCRYDGSWFSVIFGEEETVYVFNGEGTILDDLANLI